MARHTIDPTERHNLIQIDRLNQRGGRMLSIVDLMAAGTLDIELAARLMCAVAGGASFFTAARPGGAGKTTVMAALLSFLPLGRRVVTVRDPSVLNGDHRRDECLLVHEIGSGPWFGYLWGSDVARLFALMRDGVQVASCQHADELDEWRGILHSPPLSVPADHIPALDIVLFLQVDQACGRTRHRVAAVHESTRDEYVFIHRWRREEDAFERVAESPLLARLEDAGALPRARKVLAGLVANDVRTLERVRERVLEEFFC